MRKASSGRRRLGGLVLVAAVVFGTAGLLGGAAIVVDEDFSGASLDPVLWHAYGADGEASTATVSGGRLTMPCSSSDWQWVSYYLMSKVSYKSSRFYDVRVERMDEGFRGGFGFGVDELGNRLDLVMNGSTLTVQYGSAWIVQDVGPWVDGDYAIDWIPTEFKIYRNGELLFAELDPARVPYYDQMNFGMGVHAGSISFDRVVLLPEPGTMGLVLGGLVLVGGWVGRKRG